MDDEDIRDKQDRDLELDSPDIERSLDLDDKSVGEKEGCPTCGNEDIQSAELLEAWKEIEGLKEQLIEVQGLLPVSPASDVQNILIPREAAISLTQLTEEFNPSAIQGAKPGAEIIDWQHRYDKIKDAYIKTRLEVSGSFGNWDFNTKKRVLEKEISAEVGFTI